MCWTVSGLVIRPGRDYSSIGLVVEANQHALLEGWCSAAEEAGGCMLDSEHFRLQHLSHPETHQCQHERHISVAPVFSYRTSVM